jgi:hypothetical protein
LYQSCAPAACSNRSILAASSVPGAANAVTADVTATHANASAGRHQRCAAHSASIRNTSATWT